MIIEYALIDTFSEKPFMGNPAVVCYLDHELPKQIRQDIASEINQPKCVFLRSCGDSCYHINWHDKYNETNLCIHGIYAAAWYIAKCKKILTKFRFKYDTGFIDVLVNNEEVIITVKSVNLFSKDNFFVDYSAIIGKIHYDIIGNSEFNDAIIRVDSADILQAIAPDYSILLNYDMDGLIVTSLGDKVDYCVRYFCPRLGINEDYVCGLAHLSVFEYWRKELSKKTCVSEQLSCRPGKIIISAFEDGFRQLKSSCVVISTGKIYI